MYRLALSSRFLSRKIGHSFGLASRFSSSSKSAVNVTILPEGVAVIKLDTPDSKVNVLSRAFNEELERVFKDIEANPNVKASVLISTKPDNFIAGADINMLSACKTAKELSDLSRAGQVMLNRIEKGKPVVAAINGSCLGGGLEVALACHYRIASESEKTVFGLPEVKLGLLPGAGGTQRLPRQIGLLKSLDIILTGKNVYPVPAKKLNLVDQLADPFALESAAVAQALVLAESSQKKKKASPSLINKAVTYLTESFGPGRNFVLNKARQTVLKQTKGKYPAPLKALEAVEAGFAQGIEKGLEVESKNFGELGMTPASKALISIFNGSNALKKNPFKEHKSKQEVKTIGVVGAGLMGAGIAGVSVEKGFSVVLKDVQHPALARGEKQVHTYFQEKVKKKQLTGFARDRKLSSLIPIVDTTVFEKYLPKVDLLLEAVLEELSLKHKVLQQIEPHLPSHAIIATNTSAIPIQDIASGLKHPERLVGMHYFSPVEKMPLLEIILGPNTSLATAAAAFDVGLKQGKTVIVAKDVPGFYVNRSLGPYMAETMALLYQGADIEKIDKAMKDFGMPVGPIALADEVGLDVAYHVQHTLRDALGQRMAGGDDSILKEMMSNKFLGKKAQSGFFDYSNPKEKKKPVSSQALEIIKKFQKDSSAEQLSVEEIQERLVARLVNEAIFCLQDKIIDSPVVGDIGLVFGIGFPPFLGGPFRYVDSIGTDKFYDRLKKLSAKYGPQFEPAPLLAELKGKPFHDQ